MTLEVEVGPGSYERIFFDIEHAAFEMCPPAMMSDPSRIILGVPRLRGVDDGERRRQIVCRAMRGRTRSHPNLTAAAVSGSHESGQRCRLVPAHSLLL